MTYADRKGGHAISSGDPPRGDFFAEILDLDDRVAPLHRNDPHDYEPLETDAVADRRRRGENAEGLAFGLRRRRAAPAPARRPVEPAAQRAELFGHGEGGEEDRKSTRLNSS